MKIKVGFHYIRLTLVGSYQFHGDTSMNKHLSSIKKTAVLVAVGWLAVPAFAGIGGFIDAQVTDGKEVNPNAEIADAAVYLSKELGRGKMMVDLPFSYTAANAAGTQIQQDNTAIGDDVTVMPYATAFRAFNKKAQAYVSWSYDFGLSWTLGRFDSPFLNESQDTVGLNSLTTQGILFGALPNMHNGLMLSYGQGPVTVMGIASRADGRVTEKEDNENLEYGVMGKWTSNAMYVGAGLYLHKPTTETHSVVEVMAGTKMSDWTIDAQALFTKVATSGADSGFGIGGTIGYQLDKMWSFAVRPNYLSKVATNNGNEVAQAEVNNAGISAASWHRANGAHSQMQIAFGPQANLSDDFRIRANYTWSSTKATASSESVTDGAWALSAVYKF